MQEQLGIGQPILARSSTQDAILAAFCCPRVMPTWPLEGELAVRLAGFAGRLLRRRVSGSHCRGLSRDRVAPLCAVQPTAVDRGIHRERRNARGLSAPRKRLPRTFFQTSTI